VTTPDLNLFGEVVTEPENRATRRKKHQANGYAAPPGSGPTGETCKTCINAHNLPRGARSYWKCLCVKPTHGTGTDIRLKSPACRYWRSQP